MAACAAALDTVQADAQGRVDSSRPLEERRKSTDRPKWSFAPEDGARLAHRNIQSTRP